MDNIDIIVEDGKMKLIVDLNKSIGLSKSGRSVMVAKSGNQSLWIDGKPTDYHFNLNVFREPREEDFK